MAHADALSRAPVDIPYDKEQELEDYEVMLAMTEEEHVMALQRSDEKLRYIINNLIKRPEERSVAEDSMIKNYVLRESILYRTVESNGQIERVNSTLVPVLQANMTNEGSWDKKLLEVESQLNNSPNKTVGDTSFHILYDYHASFHDGVLRYITIGEEYEDVDKLQEQARVNIEKEQVEVEK
ncbi:hypothetical protein QTP88_012294 [Uroleucon formosanum]